MRWIKWIKETNDQVNDWTGSLAKRVKWAELRSFEDARAYSRRQAQTNQLVVWHVFFFWWCLTKWMQHTSKTRGKQQKITRRRLCAPTGALRRSAFVVQFGPFPLLRSTHFHPIRVLGESVPSSVTWSMQKSANFFWYGDFVCQLQHFMQIRCKFPVTLSMVTRSVDWL